MSIAWARSLVYVHVRANHPQVQPHILVWRCRRNTAVSQQHVALPVVC
jgi:hypothetical protein